MLLLVVACVWCLKIQVRWIKATAYSLAVVLILGVSIKPIQAQRMKDLMPSPVLVTLRPAPTAPAKSYPLREKVLRLAKSIEGFLANGPMIDGRWKDEYVSRFGYPLNNMLDALINDGFDAKPTQDFCLGVKDQDEMVDCVKKLRALAKTIDR
jgi:hypothetical protein